MQDPLLWGRDTPAGHDATASPIAIPHTETIDSGGVATRTFAGTTHSHIRNAAVDP